MILAALLVPVAVLAIVLLVERARLPVFLAIMAAVVGYGVANQMTFSSVSKAFGLGFVQTLEQVGLLVMAGAIVVRLLGTTAIGTPGAAVSGALAGLGASAAGGLALLQPVASGAPRRAVGLLLTLLAAQALIAPAPLAVAAASVMKLEMLKVLPFALPVALIAAAVGWLYVGRLLADSGPRARPSWTLIAIAAPIALLVVAAIAQMPTEPLGKGGAREFYTGIAGPLMLALLAIALALLATRRWPTEILADTSWAPPLLAVGAAGGLARVFDESGMADLLAERLMRPEFGLLASFLAAATVKTMQGNSLSAVLTASGMTEPMLGALGLDSATGRALAAAAAGVGSITVVHLNDPLFWIGAHMAGLSPRRALLMISLGSAVLGIAALAVLLLVRLVA
jgi:GntP family gluconate:H+ symporter